MADDTSQQPSGLSWSHLGGLMQVADPQLLVNLGLGIASAGKYGGNLGDGLMGAMNNYTAQKAAQQNYQINALNLQRQRVLLSMIPGLMQGQGGPTPAAAPNAPAAPAGGLLQAGGVSPSPPPAASATVPTGPSFLSPPSAADISGIPVGGMNPQAMPIFNLLSGKEPLAGDAEIRAAQQQRAQQRFAPQIAQLASIVNSDSPTRDVKADQQLLATWQHYATARGLDADKDFTDPNVRQVMGGVANAYRQQLGMAEVAPPIQGKQVKLPLGGVGYEDPKTGEIKEEVKPEELQSVIGGNGQPTLVRKSQAEGMTPFNPSIFGAANASDQAIQFAADTYRATGKMPASLGRNPLMQARILDRVAQDAQTSGDSAGSINARAAGLKAKGQALDQQQKMLSATTSYYQTMDSNLTKLQELAGKVDSTGSPLVNKVFRAYQQGVAGDPDVSAYVTYLRSVETEFAKIQSGSLGNQGITDAARREAQDTINKYMSTGQLSAVAQAMRGEGNNRLTALKQQVEDLQGQLGSNAPKPWTTPNTPKPAASPALTNAKGWALHKDAQGRQAYVSPDGKNYELVP